MYHCAESDRLEILCKENRAASTNVNRTGAGRFKSEDPPPRTINGEALHAELNGILQGRKLAECGSNSLSIPDMKLAEVCLQKLSLEWRHVLLHSTAAIDESNLVVQRLEKKVKNLEAERKRLEAEADKQADQATEGKKPKKEKKGADTSQLSAREKAARAAKTWLVLAQRRAARFEELSKLFDAHRRALRDRHATSHAHADAHVHLHVHAHAPRCTKYYVDNSPYTVTPAGCASARSSSMCAAASSLTDLARLRPTPRYAPTRLSL